MKSLQRRFYGISEKNSMTSSFICFARAIAGQNFSRQTIRRWFYKLVDKSDYARNEVKELLSFLWNLSNRPEDGTKKG